MNYLAKYNEKNEIEQEYRENKSFFGLGLTKIEKWVPETDKEGNIPDRDKGKWVQLDEDEKRKYLDDKTTITALTGKKSTVSTKSLLGFGLATSVIGGGITYGLTMVPWATVASGIGTAAMAIGGASVGLLPALGVGALAVGLAVGGAFAAKKIYDIVKKHRQHSRASFVKAEKANKHRVHSMQPKTQNDAKYIEQEKAKQAEFDNILKETIEKLTTSPNIEEVKKALTDISVHKDFVKKDDISKQLLDAIDKNNNIKPALPSLRSELGDTLKAFSDKFDKNLKDMAREQKPEPQKEQTPPQKEQTSPQKEQTPPQKGM